MIIKGIKFNMEWRKGNSPRDRLPRDYGIYCEIVWPVRGIRIGITQNIRKGHGDHASWMRSMKKGKSSRSKRSGPLTNHAKDWGDLELETFTLSTDPRLQEEDIGCYYKTKLHEWAAEQTEWKNFNGQKWRPINYGNPVLDEVAAAEVLGVTLKWSLP